MLRWRDVLTTVWAVLTGASSYVVLAPPIYALFYQIEPYNRVTGEGLFAFKTLFVLAAGVHVLASWVVAVLMARLLRTSAVLTGVLIVPVTAPLVFLTLAYLDFVNACLDIAFPFGMAYCN